MPIPFSRRGFLKGSLALAGVSWIRAVAGSEAMSALPPAAPGTEVLEVWLSTLAQAQDRLRMVVVEEAMLSAIGTLGDEFPLDALATLFPDEPPVAVLVDARSGGATTRALAKRLAGALIEMGSPGESVTILDARDADLKAGGYAVAREGRGPRCFGTEPRPGYGEPVTIDGSRATARLSHVLQQDRAQIAVVGRLRSGLKAMEPFVLDAALRGVDAATRERARSDPEFGARLLSSPHLGGRVRLVLGDLIEVETGAGTGSGGPRPDAAGAASDSVRPPSAWKADELLVGRNLFALERVGHTLLSEARRARGLDPLEEPPILRAAVVLGIPGAGLSSVRWRKALQ